MSYQIIDENTFEKSKEYQQLVKKYISDGFICFILPSKWSIIELQVRWKSINVIFKDENGYLQTYLFPNKAGLYQIHLNYTVSNKNEVKNCIIL